MKRKPFARILWNRRPDDLELNGGDIDEIVISGHLTVHVEQMSDHYYWIGIYDDATGNCWSGNFSCGDRARLSFHEQDSEIAWDEDETHRGTSDAP